MFTFSFVASQNKYRLDKIAHDFLVVKLNDLFAQSPFDVGLSGSCVVAFLNVSCLVFFLN